MGEKRKSSVREIFGWAMFDFANSSYTTVIITVVFSVIFPRIIVGDERTGNLLWSAALSLSYLLVLVASPVLGAITDFSASKKKFLFASTILTVFSTAALYFVNIGDIFLCIVLIILSNFGFSTGEAFVSSFLPHLGEPKDLGKISGMAWGLGYFGGLASTAIVLFGLGDLAVENFPNLRYVGPITGAFFLIAAIPTFLWVKERGIPQMLPQGENHITIGFTRLVRTVQDFREFKDMIILLSSFFFAFAGLSIVIAFSFIYGDQVIKWDRNIQILMFIVTQITAAFGALLFGFIQDRIGMARTFIITLVLWVFGVTLIYGTGQVTRMINSILGASFEPQHLFVVIGSITGVGLGATQSACRAMVGTFSPESKSGEFFGLWNLAGKLSAIFGLITLGLLQNWLGLHKAILLCSLFFLIAIVIVLPLDEKRGREAARNYAGD